MEMIKHWPGQWRDVSDPSELHEAERYATNDKAHHQLQWRPQWDFSTTVERTVNWYKAVNDGDKASKNCLSDIEAYQTNLDHAIASPK